MVAVTDSPVETKVKLSKAMPLVWTGKALGFVLNCYYKNHKKVVLQGTGKGKDT